MKNGLRKSIREKLKKKSLHKLFLTRKKTCSFGSSMLNKINWKWSNIK